MPRRSIRPDVDAPVATNAADAAPWAGAVAAIGSLTDEVVPDLVRRLNRSGLGELEVRSSGWRVRLRRPAGTGGDAVQASARRPERLAGERSGRSRPEPEHGAAPADDGLVSSLAVGYFVDREGTEAGTVVRAGDAVGWIDVLGVREDIVAPRDGVIESFEVAAGQAVEYGQPIARLRPATPAQLSET